jgi:hypothetical protein
MKPKPLVALNHFTVPLAIVISPVCIATRDLAVAWPSVVTIEAEGRSRQRNEREEALPLAHAPFRAKMQGAARN